MPCITGFSGVTIQSVRGIGLIRASAGGGVIVAVQKTAYTSAHLGVGQIPSTLRD